MIIAVFRTLLKIGFCLLAFILVSSGALAQDKYHFVLEGKVIDYDSKQPLKNVRIIKKKTKIGTVTDENGYFRFNTTNTNFTIQLSFVGYIPQTRDIDLSRRDTSIVIELKLKANVELDSVVINTRKGINKVKEVQMGTIAINPEALKRVPLVFGEADIIKGLLLQPGVTNTGEASAGFNVRGGNADQNLVLLDGATLFSTSHLLGFYSSVTPDAVQDITLYKGSMPAQYGGRLSSLLNMKAKSGDPNKSQFISGVSPISVHLFGNGPIIKDKLTVAGGIRVAYPNLVLNNFPKQFGDSRAFFYDAILKAEYSFNKSNKLSVTGYRSFDKFRFDTLTEYQWQTNLVSLNYTGNFNPKLSLRVNANYSQFISGINGLQYNYEFTLKSSIAQKQAKAVLQYNPNTKNKIEFGPDFIYYNISPGNQDPSSSNSFINPIHIEKEQGREMALFLSDEINFTSRIALQAGIRYVKYDYLGPKNVYSYQEGVPEARETVIDTTTYGKNESIKSYGGWEPRASLKIGIDDQTSIKLSYQHGQQFLQLISNTISISPVDFWKLSDSHIPQQIGDQYGAGIFRNINGTDYEISLEGYYKTAKNMVEYKDGAILLLNPYIESSLLKARGKAYGVEMSFAKNTGKVTMQINYTYSRSMMQVLTPYASEAVNKGEYYPSNIDRPHNIALIGKIKMGRGWSFNANFVFISGRPTTYPDGNYSTRNQDRLPAYHRLDIGFSNISKRYATQKTYSVWNFSIYNVYAHDNAYSIYFKRQGGTIGSYQLSVIGTAIPSISWNFYF